MLMGQEMPIGKVVPKEVGGIHGVVMLMGWVMLKEYVMPVG